ncbi:MAG: SOS response-associated peptidase family protein [Sphingomonadaceae bacterium]|nr:SOS response-associated peptidase family protein [Altererythrobacter sp.]MCP5390454.1 SOS response-associated peptidase family protein [Sphingomonadaceae bacterium]MCP5393349.1 SOS response-associated peptidase family protein [Sphingomonadaceae bacterium]
MTLLYRLDASAADIARRFGARVGDDPWNGGYCTPGKFAPVITAGREFIAGPRPAGRRLEPRMVPRLWGVMPPPSAGDPTRLVATLRNPDSPFWIGNLRNSEFRCLIPATAFMEWGNGTDYEGRRLKHWFAPEGEEIFAMAGVWKDDEVPGFALLTLDAAGLPKRAGCRSMPLVLPDDEEARQAWLHGGRDSASKLLDNHAADGLRELARG